MTSEEFHKTIKENEIWWDTCKKNHRGKDIKGAIDSVFAHHLAKDTLKNVDMSDCRTHVYNKLNFYPQVSTRVETNYQHEPKPKDLHTNPLTDEERKSVDTLLEEYKSKLKEALKPIPAMDKKRIELEGQERPKKHTPFPSSPNEILAKNILHEQYLRECYHQITMDQTEKWLPEDEWLELKANQ